MTVIIKKPFLFSFILIIITYLTNQIPVSDVLIHFGLDDFNSNSIENIIFNIGIIYGLIFIIHKEAIPLRYKEFKIEQFAYYFPLIFYLFIFSGGLTGFSKIEDVENSILTVYGIETITSAFLEELLFRGVILGLLITKYSKSEYGVMKAILFSSLIFGSMHFLNFWTNPSTMSLKGVFNQIYAVTSLGFMYGAAYLKTRNLLVIAIIHSISNFLAGVGELGSNEIIASSIKPEESILTVLITEVIRLVIFGIPLLIGLMIIKLIEQKDINNFVSEKK